MDRIRSLARPSISLISALALLAASFPVTQAHAATGCPTAIPPTDFVGTVVTNTADSGEGSLRAAMEFANADPGPNTIVFEIPLTDPGFFGDAAFADGWFVIRPLDSLPDLLDDGTAIDATTQTAFTGDTNPQGPEIVLDGSLAFEATGFVMVSNSNTIRGFAINSFPNSGIVVGCGPASRVGAVWGNVIRGSYIGTGARGEDPAPNGTVFSSPGVFVDFAVDTVIGGANGADRNVISGNAGAGLVLSNLSTGTSVQGNFIGTNAGGGRPVPNADAGIRSHGGSSGTAATVIGGFTPQERNIISGNAGPGVSFGAGSEKNFLRGNYIGTDVSGSYAVPNGGVAGVFSKVSGPCPDFCPTHISIGGGAFGAGNLISGNLGQGVTLQGDTLQVVGNLIGTDATGGSAIPNGGDGIDVGPHGALEGVNLIQHNTIAHNGGIGVAFDAAGTLPDEVALTISENAIFGNGGLGIDLGEDGVTPNDPGDGDSGENGLQNFPVLTEAKLTPAGLHVAGHIDTPSPETVTIEFFANRVPTPGGDPSGHGEGAEFLGTATPDADGNFSKDLPSVPEGTLITGTATDAGGHTSEFAANIEAQTAMPTSINECKNGGWQSYGVFKNQGDCVRFVASKGKNSPGGP